MRLLLDTHAFLWWVVDSSELSLEARSAIVNPDNECLLSIASCWEMAIKLSLGKLRLPETLDRFVPDQMVTNGFGSLAISFRHVARVASMPFHHRDPFDRLLAAQSLDEQAPIVSADPIFRRYGVERVW